MESAQLVWIKARALLLPTPLVDIDPQGESDRKARIEEKLGPFPGTEAPNDAFFERCHHDAYLAQVGSAEIPTIQGVLGLANPFSAELQPVPKGHHEAVIQQVDNWLKDLTPFDTGDPACWYRRLWSKLMALDPVGKTGLQIPNSALIPDHGVLSQRTLKAALAGARAGGGDAVLLMMHLGPVQGFIRAARRTHDSWMGSYLVGYLTWRAVVKLAESAGPDALIYPFLQDTPLAWQFLGKKVERDELLHVAIPNRFLAVVSGESAAAIVKTAAEAAQTTWEGFAQTVRGELKLTPAEAAGWDEQIRNHLEIDAVTVPWPSDSSKLNEWISRLSNGRTTPIDAPYQTLYDTASRWLSAQRGEASPAFSPPPQQAETLPDIRPKCGQCGQRAQMGPIEAEPRRQLRKSRVFWQTLSKEVQQRGGGGIGVNNDDDRLALDLPDGEGLCAVCLTKRFVARWCFGAKAKDIAPEFPFVWNKKAVDRPYLRFPSVESIATAPYRKWVANLGDQNVSRALKDWVNHLQDLHQKKELLNYDPPGNLLPGLGNLGVDEFNILSYDGSWWNEDAYEPKRCFRDYFARPAPEGDGDPDDQKRLKELETYLPKAFRAFRRVQDTARESAPDAELKPTPYYAVLVMDVDGMGMWLRGDHPEQPTVGELSDLGKRWLPSDSRRPNCPARHTEISRRIAKLAATEIPAIVHRHLGRAVYCGGDDLVAFLPIHTVFACADSVRDHLRGAEYLGFRVAVSAGITIAHSRMPLGEALKAAHDAEQRAKGQGGNRLGISVQVRSGDPLSGVWPWTVAHQPREDPPRETEPARLNLPQEMEKLRRWTTPQGDPVLDGPVITRLAEEAPILGTAKLLPAFQHRLAALTARRVRDKERLEPPISLGGELAYFQAWMDETMAGSSHKDEMAKNQTAAHLSQSTLQLLLILRFLRREAGSVAADTFLGSTGSDPNFKEGTP
ncbi:MAG: type III-B CRISPR-associated protein Cas10/Cmr2 [Myxococcales bacterium]|nr:type III-B CRISPR-associated protein Cas10/Cmr2 [Myxococcales bacterium]